jgi:transcriptional regulator
MGTLRPRGTLDVLRGSLDVLILKSLSFGPQHGYTVARWIREQSQNDVLIEEGALYPALHRLEAQDLIAGSWGVSDNNRRARFYRLTPKGRRQLRTEMEGWNRYAQAVGRVLQSSTGPGMDGA